MRTLLSFAMTIALAGFCQAQLPQSTLDVPTVKVEQVALELQTPADALRKAAQGAANGGARAAVNPCPCNQGACDCPHCWGLDPVCPCANPPAKNPNYFSQGYLWEWDLPSKTWWYWNKGDQKWHLYVPRAWKTQQASQPVQQQYQQFQPMMNFGNFGGFSGGGMMGGGGCSGGG